MHKPKVRGGRVAWLLLAAGLGLWSSCLRAEEKAVLAKGHVYLEADFEGADPRWSGPVRFEAGHNSRRALVVERAAGAPADASTVVRASLPVEQMRGYRIQGSAFVKAEGVTAKPNSWNGIKFMAAIETPTQRLWPQADVGTGSFDWARAAFSARIPPDATAVTLYLGLEKVAGKVWFDDVKISVGKPPVAARPRPAPGPPFKGHSLPRLRGTMVSPNVDEAGLRVLGSEWKANLIRWQLIRHAKPGTQASIDDYDPWLEGELKKLDAALPLCEKHGLYVVVDLHSPPGGKATVSWYVGSDDRLFTDKACQAKFVEVWQRIATRYRDAKAIWGYDLANEPVETLVGEDCDDWQDLAERTAKAIRAIDPDRAIIVEPAPWGGPGGLRELVPIDVPNVVYSAHMYVPGAFTHQGVHRRGEEVRYPGPIEGKHWDKAQLEAALQPVIDFQKLYGVHIYIGEFSAIRWAPDASARRYLKDVIDIFEAHGWDWSYHAFREWHGWSVEHGDDRENNQPAASPTDRQRLLCEWFARNQKPRW